MTTSERKIQGDRRGDKIVTIPGQELRLGDVLDNGVVVSGIEVLPPAGDGSPPPRAGESGPGAGFELKDLMGTHHQGGEEGDDPSVTDPNLEADVVFRRTPRSSAFGISMARRYSGERD